MGNIGLNFRTCIVFRKLYEMYPTYPNSNLEKNFYKIKRFKRLQIRYLFQITLYSRMILKIYGYIIPTHFALYYDKIFVVIM